MSPVTLIYKYTCQFDGCDFEGDENSEFEAFRRAEMHIAEKANDFVHGTTMHEVVIIPTAVWRYG
jgi:hypothetical protein